MAPDIARAVQAARLQFAYSNLPMSLVISILLAAMTAIMLHGSGALTTRLSWFGCLAAVNGLRLLDYRQYRADSSRNDVDLAAYDRHLLVGCCVAGLLWGSSAILFLPSQPELQFFLAFVIAGVSSGAVSSLSVAPPAAYAFVFPCVLPLTVQFLCAGDALHLVMGIMTALYMLILALVAHRGHLQLTRLVASRLETQSTQAALRSSEVQRQNSDERLRVAAEAGQIGVWEWDLRSNELLWDERMYRMYHVDANGTSGHYDMWRLRVHPADLARVEKELQTAVTGSNEFRTEFRIVWPDNEERFIKAAATVGRSTEGTALRVTGINLDITELRRLERIKSEFVSVVSHELRTPLTSIRGSLGLLVNDTTGTLPTGAKDLLRVADRNAARLGSLIEDLLDVEKLEAGKLRLQLQSQPLRPLIEQSLEVNTPYATQHAVTLELTGETSNTAVMVDADRIIQVMTNLLSNAVKFSPLGSRVLIMIERTATNGLRVAVRDCGSGISPQFRPHLFTKFSQCDASDSRPKGGTGLGLAISKALIEEMGGSIGFEAAEGQGTIFFFELPTCELPAC